MKKQKNEKNFWGKIFPLILLFPAILSIIKFSLTEWKYADIFLNIAIGLLTSSIVTIAFEKIQQYKDLQEKKRKRAAFLLELKLFMAGTLDYIDFSKGNVDILSLDDYFKLQHRYFHEHYKKMYASNANQKETQCRVEQMKWFYGEMDIHLKVILGSTYDWKECGFNLEESHRITEVYKNYCRGRLYLEKEDFLRAIASFAVFLDELRLLLLEIEELNTFRMIRFDYKNGNLSKVDFERFALVEPYIVRVAQDSEARRADYQREYGK